MLCCVSAVILKVPVTVRHGCCFDFTDYYPLPLQTDLATVLSQTEALAAAIAPIDAVVRGAQAGVSYLPSSLAPLHAACHVQARVCVAESVCVCVHVSVCACVCVRACLRAGCVVVPVCP